MKTRVKRPVASTPAWHAQFEAMLPTVCRYANRAFRHLNPEARQEEVQEVICHVCRAIARLAELNQLDRAFPTVLTRFAIKQVKAGRRVGCSLNIHDVSSKHCQLRKKVAVQRLDLFNRSENAWREAVIVDTRAAPVPETVAFRCDFADWLAQLKRRDRRLAEALAVGNRTQEVAKRFHLSDGRVSQLRNELAQSWHAFVEDFAH